MIATAPRRVKPCVELGTRGGCHTDGIRASGTLIFPTRSCLKQPGRRFTPSISLLGRVLWEEFPDAVDSILYSEFHRAVRDRCPVEFTSFSEPLDPAWFSVRAVAYAGGLLVFFRPVTDEKVIEAKARALATQDAALREVATAVARGSDEDMLFALLARTTGELLGADAAGVLQLDSGGDGVTVVGAWSNGGPLVEPGTHLPDVYKLSIAGVLLSQRPSVVLRYEEGSDAALAKMGYHCAVPLR